MYPIGTGSAPTVDPHGHTSGGRVLVIIETGPDADDLYEFRIRIPSEDT
jgi:hypothetical protein